MCLYPKLIKNRKYSLTKKNGGEIPILTDKRVQYVPVGCQNCMECRKQKAREWQVRLLEDIKQNKNGKFITLTFSNESIKELINQKPTKQWRSLDGLTGYDLDNEIATRAVRLWLERWRKKYKKSIRHWLVTEIGHNGTENIHLHGIVWLDTGISLCELETVWKYGYVWKGKGEKKINYVNESTVNYITKYITKRDEIHITYKSKILTSPGIGNGYTKTTDATKNKYKPGKTNETYKTRTGHKMSIPIYWRNKIYTEEEREKLWIEKLDKNIRWIGGEKVNVNTEEGMKAYMNGLKKQQELNRELGYGSDEKDFDKEEYERQQRILRVKERLGETSY